MMGRVHVPVHVMHIECAITWQDTVRINGAFNPGVCCHFTVARCSFRCYSVSMNATNDTNKLLSDAAEQIRKEAYSKGWRDAFARLEVALAEFKEMAEIADKISVNGSATAKPSSKQSTGKMPKLGTTPHAILTEVMNHPGMTGGQIVEAVRNSGHTAPAPSIQTNIQRLKQRKMIVLRHGKWYAE